MKNNLAMLLSILSIIGVIFVIYHQNIYIPNKLQKCHTISINIEKARHYPTDDLAVTNQDISGYMKNMVSCFAN